jgi:hypothetical protein
MTMTRRMTTVAALAAVWLVSGAPLGAQQPQQPPKRVPPAKVSVLIERYQADKKVASMPFTLWLTPRVNGSLGSNGSLRIGVNVPIGSTTTTRGTTSGNTSQNAVTSAPQYEDVGTQIDCNLGALDQDGMFVLGVRLSDSSIYDPNADRQAALVARGLAPAKPASALLEAWAFRTFSFDNAMEMRDGQTAEYVNATDKTTGELVKVLVTLNIQK